MLVVIPYLARADTIRHELSSYGTNPDSGRRSGRPEQLHTYVPVSRTRRTRIQRSRWGSGSVGTETDAFRSRQTADQLFFAERLQRRPRYVRYDGGASVQQSEIRCLHKRVDANDFESAFVLRTGYALTLLRDTDFGLTHCLTSRLIGRASYPRVCPSARSLSSQHSQSNARIVGDSPRVRIPRRITSTLSEHAKRRGPSQHPAVSSQKPNRNCTRSNRKVRRGFSLQ